MCVRDGLLQLQDKFLRGYDYTEPVYQQPSKSRKVSVGVAAAAPSSQRVVLTPAADVPAPPGAAAVPGSAFPKRATLTSAADVSPSPEGTRTPVYDRSKCVQFTDGQIWQKNIKARRGSDGKTFLGHVDRYRRDPQYASRMQQHEPPTPMWLVFSAGNVLRADGEHGDQRDVDALLGTHT